MVTHKILVILHVYYGRMWMQLAKCVECIKTQCRCDIVVTIPDNIEGDVFTVRYDVLNLFPEARIMQVENKGFDVGPFFEVLNGINLDEYDFVVKLHTKRDIHGMANGWVNGFHLSGSKWRDILLEFCSSREAVRDSIQRFVDDQKVGVVSCDEVIVSSDDYYERRDPDVTCRALRLANVEEGSFVAGTMFMIRANLLKPIQGRWCLKDFSNVAHDGISNGNDDLLPYVLERLMGYIVCAQGFKLVDYRKSRPFYGVCHFMASSTAQVLRFIRGRLGGR